MNSSIHPGVPNLVLICVDATENKEVTGRLYTRYQTRASTFSSLWEAGLLMERLFDTLNIPQASVQQRDFFGEKSNLTNPRKELSIMQSNEDMMKNKGGIATFVVHVQYRQNATWQGKIVWAEKKTESSFRSALEMMKLMDMALESSGSEDKSVEGGE